MYMTQCHFEEVYNFMEKDKYKEGQNVNEQESRYNYVIGHIPQGLVDIARHG